MEAWRASLPERRASKLKNNHRVIRSHRMALAVAPRLSYAGAEFIPPVHIMSRDAIVDTSKLLSYVLRHRPDSIGLRLDANGWADVDVLLQRLAEHGKAVDRALLERVVADNDKQRFAFDAGRTRIRASQGHSIQVDLALQPAQPPDVLYHGTASRFLKSILASGLRAGNRRHVHLSGDADTARRVGARHGFPVILHVDTARMRADGAVFYRSDNGVWLTGPVAPRYLRVLDGNGRDTG
jgi:putative RNA 2'-phosphotransferase